MENAGIEFGKWVEYKRFSFSGYIETFPESSAAQNKIDKLSNCFLVFWFASSDISLACIQFST